ncbi:MAG: hypothetical protein C0418_04830 [Coriobacteriaceae bacterium]|nr:hypothetical protein [Coriobacteriaceae bacterium]
MTTGPHRRHFVPGAAPAVVALLVAGAAALSGAPHARAAEVPVPAVRSVTLEREADGVPSGGAYTFDVVSSLATDPARLQVRMQMRSPAGRLIIQKTETLSDVTSDTVVTRFSRPLADLGLRPGRYPLLIRVRATTRSGRTSEYVLEDRLLLYDPGAGRVPVAVIARVRCSPGIGPDGRFVEDPGLATGSRDAAVALADILRRRPGARLSVAMTPEMLEEWQRVSEGYETAGAEGIRRVADTEPVPRAYADALARLATAAADGRMELIDVPYADPDLAGLRRIGALPDLGLHYARGTSIYRSALEATPSGGTAVSGDVFPADAIGQLRAHGTSFVVVAPRSLVKTKSLVAGPHRLKDTTMTALVCDERLGRLAADREATPTLAIDRVFDRLASASPTAPVVAVVEVGPGTGADPGVLERFLERLESSGWSRPVTAAEAARLRSALPPVRLAEAPSSGAEAPAGYWASVAEARADAHALAAATAPGDRDAEAAAWDLMLAQSRCWAGGDGSWVLADRGAAFASAARRLASAVFSGIRMDLQDVTLAGKSGKVPVNVVNGSDKTLRLTLDAEAQKLVVNGGETTPVTLRPSDNYLTLDVDLRGAISDRLTLRLRAGTLEVATAEATIGASVLDRIVLVAGVVLVLGVLLVFIRRRLSEAETDAGRIDGVTASRRRSGRR